MSEEFGFLIRLNLKIRSIRWFTVCWIIQYSAKITFWYILIRTPPPPMKICFCSPKTDYYLFFYFSALFYRSFSFILCAFIFKQIFKVKKLFPKILLYKNGCFSISLWQLTKITNKLKQKYSITYLVHYSCCQQSIYKINAYKLECIKELLNYKNEMGRLSFSIPLYNYFKKVYNDKAGKSIEFVWSVGHNRLAH